MNTSKSSHHLLHSLRPGDIVWVDIADPDSHGSRTKIGTRPCVVLSDGHFHVNFGLATIVPITRQNHYPLSNIPIAAGKVTGFAEPHQIKAVDLISRGFNIDGSVSEDELADIVSVVHAFTNPLDL